MFPLLKSSMNSQITEPELSSTEKGIEGFLRFLAGIHSELTLSLSGWLRIDHGASIGEIENQSMRFHVGSHNPELLCEIGQKILLCVANQKGEIVDSRDTSANGRYSYAFEVSFS